MKNQTETYWQSDTNYAIPSVQKQDSNLYCCPLNEEILFYDTYFFKFLWLLFFVATNLLLQYALFLRSWIYFKLKNQVTSYKSFWYLFKF